MNYKKYYSNNRTFIELDHPRITKTVDIVSELKPKTILDIGCGSGYVLNKLSKLLPRAKFFGIDVWQVKKKQPFKYKCSDINKKLPYKSKSFDCIILGEVIEHVPDPDFLLKEINRLLTEKGTLVISTPNLVSWANRILVPFGIQPLFTETSTEVNLGRRLKFLGQGGKVQGHLKIFTHHSLLEILYKQSFSVKEKYGVPFFFPFPISLLDRVMTKFIPLSSGLLYVAKKK